MRWSIEQLYHASCDGIGIQGLAESDQTHADFEDVTRLADRPEPFPASLTATL